jgi:hypothetical protein
MDSGRNEPCPCGSGKKYKKCCLGRSGGETAAGEMRDIMDEVRRKLESGHISSLDEAQEIVADFVNRKNSAPLAKFHGLSPTQMYRLLHFPFDSPELARFASNITPPADVPCVRLLSLLVEAIGDKGLKTTTTGNLPRNFCRESARIFWGEVRYQNRTEICSIRTEPEFQEMHCLRLVAELAGVIRKYRGTFILTAKYRKALAKSGPGAVYFALFKAYVHRFNWAYLDGYPELDFPRQSFLFTLYVLQKYGGQTRPHSFYEDIFIEAFPLLLDEVTGTSYMSAEETVRHCYSYRSLADFASFFGLIEFTPTTEEYLNRQYEVRKLPLLDQFISFAV